LRKVLPLSNGRLASRTTADIEAGGRPRDDFHRCFVEGSIKQIGRFSMQFRKCLPRAKKSYSLLQLVIGN